MSPRGQKQNEQMRAEALGKITIAAVKVFAEFGYHGATMKQISQASGLSYGLVYHYFSSKEDVFRYVIDSSLDGTTNAAIAILSAPGSAWNRIEQFSTFLIDKTVKGEASAYFLVVLHAMTQGKSIPGFHGHVTKRVQKYYEIMAPLISQAQESGEAVPGDPKVLAAAYFSLVQGLALLGVQGSRIEQSMTPELLLSVLRNPTETAADREKRI